MALLVAVADDVSDRVLETGVRLGRAFGEPLSVVHLTAEETAGATERELRDRIESTLSERSIEYSVELEYVADGSTTAVADQLGEIAADTEVNHIVVGHRSKGLLGRLLTGNTAVEVARGADIPVTIVPEA